MAPAVQRGLHRLAKPWHRRRALWIFRDETGLSVTPGLWSSIQRALDGSDWFVLLASPEAARSPWVNREIEHWMATKPADRILPVVTEGLWQWDPQRGDFSEESTAVPAALRGVFAEEPLFLDLRWARDDLQLNLRHSRFRDAIAQLAAPMHGVSKDDLEGEDVRQHRRVRRLWSIAVAALVVLAMVASVSGLFAVRNAQRATAEALNAARMQQVAVEQRSSAERFADEARRQERIASQQESRAKQATEETRRQEKLAAQQKDMASRASGEALRQQENARRQQGIADAAAAQAREQGAVARSAALETARQKQIAQDQHRLAQESAAMARRQEEIAKDQQRLAQLATAEARKQEQNAKDQQALAKVAAEEARKQKGDAEQQKRIAISRRLISKAKAAIDDDPTTALMLGVAALKIQPDAEARTELAGLVTSTTYAGTVSAADDIESGRPGVLALRRFTGDVSLWNVADPTRPTRFATLKKDDHTSAETMAFSPDRRTLAVSYSDFSVILWNVSNPSRPVRSATLSLRGYVPSIAFSPDGRTMVMNDRNAEDGATQLDTIAGLWDVRDISRPRRLSTLSAENVDGANKFVFSPDGRTVLSTALQVAPVTIWNVTDRRNPVRLGELDGGPTSILEFSPVAPILITATAGDVLRWDLTDPTSPHWTTTSIGLGDSVHAGLVVSVAFSPDGRTLAARDRQGRVRLWAVVNNLPVVPLHGLTGQEGDGPLAFDSDGRTLVTTDRAGIAKLWSVRPYGEPQPVADLTAHRDNPTAVHFSPDGRSMATVDYGGTIMFWDMTTPARPVRRATVPGRDQEHATVAFSRDWRTVAVARGERVTLIDITRPTRPVTRVTFDQRGADWRGLTFSPDGRTLAVPFGSVDQPPSVALWGLTGHARPTRLSVLPGVREQFAFSPDSRTLVAVDDHNAVKLWDLTNRSAPAQLGTLAAHRDTVDVVAYSPDGRTVATGSQDGTAILSDVTNRRRPLRLATLAASDSWGVTSAVFSADSRTLVTTVDKDQRAMMWDIGDRVNPVRLAAFALTGSEEREWFYTDSLALSPDGRTMAIAGLGPVHRIVTVWDTTKLNEIRANPAKQACAITGRGLDTEEWARHIPEFTYQRTCPGTTRQ